MQSIDSETIIIIFQHFPRFENDAVGGIVGICVMIIKQIIEYKQRFPQHV